jgi:5-methyltetrahydropteroyltriglutamate--homocysteine methyltransferase
LNPNLIAGEEDLIRAWETSAEKAGKLDVQMHLHSPTDLDLIYKVDSIGVIGIESAEDPRVLEEVDRKDLESYDKSLRVGVARTNIYGIVADYRDKTGIDPWQDKGFLQVVDVMENPRIIGKRLQKAYKLFGDRIRYAGPDCGLGAWPSQESASQLLRNTAGAVEEFNKN